VLPPNFVRKRYNRTFAGTPRCRIPVIRRDKLRRSLLKSQAFVQSAAPRLLRVPSGEALPPSASLYARAEIPTPSLHSLWYSIEI